MKKLFVIVLALAMVLSLGAFAFAATPDVTAPDATGTVGKVTDGTDGTEAADEQVPSPNKTDLIIVHGGGNGKGDGDGKAERAVIVKFITGEVQKGTPINAPYPGDGKAAVELADKVVKGEDDIEDEELKEAVKAFFEENPDSLATGVIFMGEDAAEDSVKLAVSAKGFDKVQFTAPGDAEGLAFVVLNG